MLHYLHDSFAGSVEGGSRLIKEQDLWLPDNSPGNCNALPLSARQLNSSVPNLS